MTNLNQKMLMAAALAMGAAPLEMRRPVEDLFNANYRPPREPAPADPKSRPHQGAREIERRRRQMERAAAKRARVTT